MSTTHFPKTQEALGFLTDQLDASFAIVKAGECFNEPFVREQVTASRRAITTGKRADPGAAVTTALANIAFMMRLNMAGEIRDGYAVERLVILAASALDASGTQPALLPDHRTFILREIDKLAALAGEMPDGNRWVRWRDCYNDAALLPSVEEAVDLAISTVVRMHGRYIRYNADFSGFGSTEDSILSGYPLLSAAMRTLSGALR